MVLKKNQNLNKFIIIKEKKCDRVCLVNQPVLYIIYSIREQVEYEHG